MDLRNCRKCGRIFPFSSRPICSDCIQQEEDDFELVRSFLKDHPGSTIKKISAETGVTPGQIIKFFKEGKLEVSDGMMPLVSCEKCGKPIHSGKLCASCMNKLHKQFEKALTKPEPTIDSESEGVSMHLSKIKKRGNKL